MDEADRDARDAHVKAMIFNFENGGERPMCLGGRSTNLQTFLAFEPGRDGVPSIMVQPHSTLQIGVPFERGIEYNGIWFAKQGCNKQCENCAGLGAGQDTIIEFTRDVQGAFWSDISNGKSYICARKANSTNRF